MGDNLPAKKYKKTNPTITRLAFHASGNSTKYIDIAQALSIINRKAYRQGLYYYINSIEMYNSEDGYVDVSVIPDTYVTRNAWKRAFRKFQKMNGMVDTARPKYHDFKIYMSDQHRLGSKMSPDMFGLDGDYQNHTADEWAYSQFVSMDDDGDAIQEADNFFVHMIGDHSGQADGSNWNSIGLIKSYADSKPEPDQTGEPVLSVAHVTDPLNNLFDASSEEALNDIRTNLDLDNDETPYNADKLVGEHHDDMQQVARLATSAITGRVTKQTGFCAPMGLICLEPSTEISTTWRVVINLAVGTYHGVYAERV